MSENVDMYLVSIARLAEPNLDGIVPIPELAEKLNILPVSANQMIRRLEDTGLVRYLPYKGVQLTEDGRLIADQVRRQHKLWETFLITCLNFPVQEADALACRFEHIMSDEEVEHLAAFLESTAEGGLTTTQKPFEAMPYLESELTLADLAVGEAGPVTKATVDQATASFLSTMGIQIGARLAVLARAASGDLLVRVGEDGDRVHLAAELTGQICIEKDRSG